MESTIEKISLVRLVRNGKVDNYCDIVEISDLTGHSDFFDLKKISKVHGSLKIDDKDILIWLHGCLYLLPVNMDLSKNKELLVNVLLGDKLDLSKTVEFERSQMSKFERQ